MARRFTTVTTAAASYDLVTLAAVKAELSKTGTDDDTFLENAIDQASEAIATYCNRVFAVERLQDRFFLLDTDANFNIDSSADVLQLSRIPALAVLSLTENGVDLVEGTDYLVDYAAGQLVRLCQGSGERVTRWTCGPVVVSYDAGYGVSLTQDATVPVTPFQITVTQAAKFALDEGVTKDDGTVFTKVSASPAQGEYSVSAGGVYTFNAADEGAAVSIKYAYTRLPLDLAMAATRLVVMRHKGKNRDPMQVSHSEPGVGEDRWWVGGFQGASFPPEIEGLIGPYREVPV